MGYKALELTLISARELKKIGKMDVYVAVSLSAGGIRSKKLKTPVHRGGSGSGSSPYWNHTVRFNVDESAAEHLGWTVVIQLKHKRTFGWDKHVGEVRVPAKDLADGYRDDKIDVEPRILTYQVLRPSGEPQGEFEFSYRVTDVIDPPEAQLPLAGTGDGFGKDLGVELFGWGCLLGGFLIENMFGR